MDNEKLKNLISKNVFVSLFSNGFYLVTRLFIPPLTLSMVSLDEYGIWAACFVLVGYLGMGVSGIANTYVRYVGLYHKRGEIDSISRLLSTGLTIATIGMAIALFGVWFGIPGLIRAFSVPEHLQDTAFHLFFGTVCIFMAELSWGAFSFALVGIQKIVAEKIVWVIAYCLEAILIVVFLFSGMGIYALLWAFGLRYLFSISANLFLCYRAMPGLSIRLGRVDKKFFKTIIHFGGITQFNGILNMALGSIEKVIGGFFLDIKAVGLFDIGQKFPRMAIKIPGSLTFAIFPAATYLQDGARLSEIRTLYLKGSRYINLMTSVMMGYMACFALPIMNAWLGADETYANAAILFIMFTIPFQCHTTTGPATAVFKGIGKPLRESVYPLSKLVFVLLFTAFVYFVFDWSLLGIGLAVAAGIFCSTLGYMFYANYKLGVPQWRFVTRVLLPGLAAYGVAGALYLPTQDLLAGLANNRWLLVLHLGWIGVIHTVASGLLLYFVICDRDERHYFLGQAQRLLNNTRRLWRRGA